MDLMKVFLWLILAVAAWVVLSTVLSIVVAAVGFLIWLVRTAVVLAVVGGLAYGGYKLYDLLTSDNSASSVGQSGRSRTGIDSTYTESRSSVDSPQDRYARGEIDEAQLEQELERELGDGEMDSIDRELQREQS